MERLRKIVANSVFVIQILIVFILVFENSIVEPPLIQAVERLLTSLESIAEGGKNGDLWKPHDAANSLIVERLSLPLESKEHMPPKDKVQLSEDEIYFIPHWIDARADTDIKLNELAEDDTLKTLASVIIPRYQREDDKPLFALDFGSPEKIEK